MGIELKVMTFNLRIRARSDGEYIFDLRRPKVLDVINNEMPDIIGFQEANDDMIEFLQENLPEYYFLGHGREVDYRGEAPAIAYRWKKFAVHSFSQEMLSLTPQVPGSRVEGINQSTCPRAFACAELVCKENKKLFSVFNVHTDHKDQNVIFAECVMLMQSVGRRGGNFIMTGDFNARPTTPAIEMIKASREALGLVDATENIQTSFHNYGRMEEDCKIDYIFTNFNTDPAQSYAVPQPEVGYYSDHHALCTKITVE